jgi:hypothetical protein
MRRLYCRAVVFHHRQDALDLQRPRPQLVCGMDFQFQLKDHQCAAGSRFPLRQDAEMMDELRIQDVLILDVDLTSEDVGRRYLQDAVADAAFQTARFRDVRLVDVALVVVVFQRDCCRDAVRPDAELQLVSAWVPSAQEAPDVLALPQLCAPVPAGWLSARPAPVRSPPKFRWQLLE